MRPEWVHAKWHLRWHTWCPYPSVPLSKCKCSKCSQERKHSFMQPRLLFVIILVLLAETGQRLMSVRILGCLNSISMGSNGLVLELKRCLLKVSKAINQVVIETEIILFVLLSSHRLYYETYHYVCLLYLYSVECSLEENLTLHLVEFKGFFQWTDYCC